MALKLVDYSILYCAAAQTPGRGYLVPRCRRARARELAELEPPSLEIEERNGMFFAKVTEHGRAQLEGRKR